MSIDWERRARQVRLNTHEACHSADHSFPMTRCGGSGWSPETVKDEAHEGAPLPWLTPADGPAVITQAWARLTADEYTDEQRDRENQRPTHRAPMLGADRG